MDVGDVLVDGFYLGFDFKLDVVEDAQHLVLHDVADPLFLPHRGHPEGGSGVGELARHHFDLKYTASWQCRLQCDR